MIHQKIAEANQKLDEYRLTQKCLDRHPVPRGYPHQKTFPKPFTISEKYVRPAADVLGSRFTNHNLRGGVEFEAGTRTYDEVVRNKTDDDAGSVYRLPPQLKEMGFGEERFAMQMRYIKSMKAPESVDSWLAKMRKKYGSRNLFYSVLDDLYCPNCDEERHTAAKEEHQFLCNLCASKIETVSFSFEDDIIDETPTIIEERLF